MGEGAVVVVGEVVGVGEGLGTVVGDVFGAVVGDGVGLVVCTDIDDGVGLLPFCKLTGTVHTPVILRIKIFQTIQKNW